MLDIPTDELRAGIDAIDMFLQGADDTKRALVSDAYIDRLETLLEIARDHDDQIDRLKRLRQRMEEECERRRTSHAA